MRRVLTLILALAMVLSVFTGVTVAADSYTAITLDSNKVGYSDASETPTLKAYGVDADGNRTLLSEGVTWESESEKVLTIGKDTGTINFVTRGNGFSVVTAKYGDLTAKIIVHILPNKQFNDGGFEDGTVAETKVFGIKDGRTEIVTDIKRTGEHAIKTTKSNGNRDYYGMSISKADFVFEGWFYDDGTKSANYKPSFYVQDTCSSTTASTNSESNRTLAVDGGVLDSSKDTYAFMNTVGTAAPNSRYFAAKLAGLVDDAADAYVGDTAHQNITETSVKRSKGWHQFTLVGEAYGNYTNAKHSDRGMITLYIDGEVINRDPYVAQNCQLIRPIGNTSFNFYYDDIICYTPNTDLGRAPEIIGASISSDLSVGNTITTTASAVDPDADTDDMASITYKWEISADKKTWTDTGVTASSYPLTTAEEGKYLRVIITPSSMADPKDGEPVILETAGKIVDPESVKPSVSNVTVSGSASFGMNVSAKYDYEGGEYADKSEFKWEISADGTTWTEVGTDKSYTITKDDIGKKIRVTVIPKNSLNIAGTAVTSAAVDVVNGDVAYFIAPNGSDSGDGSVDAPFASFEKARDTARALRANGYDDQITIYLRGGEYYRETTLSLTSADKNLTFKPYNNEKARITGGKHVENLVSKVTDTDILDCVIDDVARDNLYVADLSSVFPNGIPALTDFSHSGKVAKDGRNDKFSNQVRLYVNGQAMSIARWPNQDVQEGEGPIDRPITVKSGDGKKGGEPSTITYNDETDRAKLWKSDLKDLMIIAHFGVHWAYSSNYVSAFNADNKALTIKYGVGEYVPKSGDEFYFSNLIDEIDMPGESYMDTENSKIYFYPYDPDNISKAEIMVPFAEKTFITAYQSTGIVMEGIDFEYVRAAAFNFTGMKDSKVDGCTFAHFTDANTFSGDNNIMQNCYLIDGAAGGVRINGGDTKTLTGGGNIVRNNVFKKLSTLRLSYSPSVNIQGYGQIVENNEISYSDHEMIAMSGMCHKVLKNEIHHAVQWTGDMGAMYWGRNPQNFGHEIAYNYFHHNGGLYAAGWSQSIFWDDGNTGPYLHDNIFYQGTMVAEHGGQYFASKTYGGQYSLVENNIFVDNPYAQQFQGYGDYDGKTGQYISSFLCYYGINYSGNKFVDYWDDNLLNGGYYTDTYKERFKGTQWQPWTELLSKDFFESTLKVYYDKYHDKDHPSKANAEDYAALTNIAHQYAPRFQNQFNNNLVVKGLGALYNGSITTESNTYFSRSPEKDLFVDYDNENFKLTDDGLAKVRQTIPDFRNIDMSDIGADSNAYGNKPVVENATVAGNPSAGNILEADYDFADADGDVESLSETIWYIYNPSTRKYERTGYYGKKLKVLPEYEGRKIYYEIMPVDYNGVFGDKVKSSEVTISVGGDVDKDELYDHIEEARKLVNNAVVGSLEGQYTQKSVDTLKAAIASANAVAANEDAVQFEVDSQVEALKTAINMFKLSVITNVEYMSLKPIITDTDPSHWTAVMGSLPQFNADGSMTVKAGSCVTYNYKKYKNVLFTFDCKLRGDEGTSVNGSFLFRIQDPTTKIWSKNSNCGYLMWFHDDHLEAQLWNPTRPGIDNFGTGFSVNTDYKMTIGVYDVADGVKYSCYINGDLLYDHTYTGTNLSDMDGYIQFYSSATDLVIYPEDVDFTKLDQAIAAGEGILGYASVGSEYGQGTQELYDAVKTAVADAKAVRANAASAQQTVDKAALLIETAISEYTAGINTKGTVASNRTYDLVYNGNNSEFDIANGAALTLNVNKAAQQPGIDMVSQTPIGTVTTNIQVGTKLSSDSWNGSLTAPVYSAAASANLNGDVYAALSFGANVSADKLIRVELPNVSGKKLAILTSRGRYADINARCKDDSYASAADAIGTNEAVKYVSGDKLVVYMKTLSELVFYASSVTVDDNPQGGGQGGGGTVSDPYGKKNNGNGFYSTDTTNPNLDSIEGFCFEDMVNHWARTDVMAMYKAGIVTGVTENTFEPDRNITRAEFAALIARTLKLEDKTADFKDVDSAEWYSVYVGACADAGIITGFDGLFRPNDNITRQEMAVIIVNAYSYLGKSGANGGIDSFTDKSEIADWAKSSVDVASSVGLISGMGDGTFGPAANATRAQAASLLSRLVK